MPYFIQVGERDEKFLETCSDIPDAKRIAVLTACKDGLANISEEARCDSIDRIAPDRFRYLYAFRGNDGAGRILRFIVDESAIAYGVLRVLFVDVIEGKKIRRLDPPPTNTG